MVNHVGNRVIGRVDANSRLDPTSYEDLAYQADNGGGSNIVYKGWARPGASTSAAVWKIQKLTYDGSTPPNVLTITWPQDSNNHASSDFQFQWSQRASYTYS